MSNFYHDNEDIQFYTKHFIGWNTIIPRWEKDFRDAKHYQTTQDEKYQMAPSNIEEALEIYEAVWEQVGKLSGEEIAGISQTLDRKGLKLQEGKVIFPEELQRIFDLFSQSGLFGVWMGRKYNGTPMPRIAQAFFIEIITRADVSLGITFSMTSMGAVLEKFASESIKEEYVKKMAVGDMSSAMALTEPNYGSDLSNVQTKATKVEGGGEGVFEITGTKRFITQACGLLDKPAALVVLARSEGLGKGAKGLSFFLVESGDVEIAGLENKIGLHASPTCEVVFDKSKALLIGEEGKGLVEYAMELMNAARLFVTYQAVGILEASYREAKKYASERQQFGKPIQDLPPVGRLLREVEATLHASRALAIESSIRVSEYQDEVAIEEETGKSIREIKRMPKIKRLEKLARLFTPVSKYFCSEAANSGTYKAAQVFGGSGFIEDYKIAQLYRDVRITTIYEGTSQLQVLGAIGGIVEGIKEGGFLCEYVNEKIQILNNNKIKARFAEHLKEIQDLVVLYKQLNDKTMYSQEVVDYFAYVYLSLLLAIQVDFCMDKKLSILATKQRAFDCFYTESLANMEAIKSKINNILTPAFASC